MSWQPGDPQPDPSGRNPQPNQPGGQPGQFPPPAQGGRSGQRQPTGAAWQGAPQGQFQQGQFPPPGQYAPPGQFPSGPNQVPSGANQFRAGQPGQYPPNAQYGTGQPPKKRSKVGLVIGIIVGVILLALLAAFFIFRNLIGGNSAKDLTFHPTGSAQVWLDSRYEQGFHTWQLPAESYHVGLSEDRQTLAILTWEWVNGGRSYHLLGLDLQTGQERWRTDNVDCDVASAVDGISYCRNLTQAGTDFMAVDLKTGATTPFYSLPGLYAELTALALFDGNLIASTRASGGTRVLSFSMDGDIAWQSIVAEGSECDLLGASLGCASSDSFTVLDASTGEVRVPATSYDSQADTVQWFTDGYAVTSNAITFESIKVPIRDFTGAEVAQADPQIPLFPGRHQGFYYPISDVVRPGHVYTVDQTGSVVSEFYGKGITLRPSGKEFEVSEFTVDAVSADGNLLLVNRSNSLFIYNRAGDELHDVGVGSWDVQLNDGILLSSLSGDPTTVYAPGA